MSKYVLALDQGTTSSRAILFDQEGRVRGLGQYEFEQLLPAPGQVEHAPEAIWGSQLRAAQAALRQANVAASELAAVGITNQRETTLLWEADTGRPLANAIVWQSRVSAGICDRLRAEGCEETIRRKTGLVVDAYFSGTKIQYLLDRYEGLRARAERGEILFGTVDTYLIWRLTGGKRHVTDYTNASRTLLFNIHTLQWDDELLRLLDIPRAMLPEVVSSSGVVGELDESWLGARIPIGAAVGDQHAATFGQTCFAAGEAKCTYGTGSFLMLNTGSKPVTSRHGLLTTIAWGLDGRITYAWEGSIFVSGAVVQWLRDGLGLIRQAADVERLAATVADAGGVVMVPAFVGLGAPYWDAYARGSIHGITRGTTAAHFARAALESMGLQTRDLIEAMQADAGLTLGVLKVDGGATANAMMLQFQADILNVPVRRPVVAETTALGAAYLAGLAVGFWSGQEELAAKWALDQEFQPQMATAERESRYRAWRRAVERTRAWEEPT